MSEQHHEQLIDRIVSGEAVDRDWDELFDRAGRDETLWRRVVESQRDEVAMASLMHRAAAVAERVELPPTALDDAAVGRERPIVEIPAAQRPLRLVGAWRTWTGWAIAAMLLVAWGVNIATQSESRSGIRPELASSAIGGATAPGLMPSEQRAGIVPVSNTRDAFQAYLDMGRADGTVLTAVPRRVLLESRPNPDGDGYELIYLQQVMERAVVPNLFRVTGQDERGRPALARYEQPVRGRM